MSSTRPIRNLLQPLREFLDTEAGSGVLLVVATLAALVWANSPVSESYATFWREKVAIGLGQVSLTKDLHHWVNDGLMVVFFFVVGLEINRELVAGELRDPRRAALPMIAAAGGAILPALIFLSFNHTQPSARGWGIPMATDIAFAVGVMALLASRVSAGAKLFLLTLAIVDDIIAVVVIALYYSTGIDGRLLLLALLGLALSALLLRSGARARLMYSGLALLGVGVWVAVSESGVHATIAGVLLAFTVPARDVGNRSLLPTLEHRLHPVSSYFVVPVFALANAGVPLGSDAIATAISSSVAWGIAVGLVVGKAVGVTSATLLAVAGGVGTFPEDMSRREVIGVASLAGIGFTVSLFIAGLAYGSVPQVAVDTAKIGILAGSVAALVVGVSVFARQGR